MKMKTINASLVALAVAATLTTVPFTAMADENGATATTTDATQPAQNGCNGKHACNGKNGCNASHSCQAKKHSCKAKHHCKAKHSCHHHKSQASE